MSFQLNQFRIPKFRSIIKSDWIRCDEITGLIGTNESGKTNILIALWKLNPANNEKIIPIEDYPRKDFSLYESTKGKEYFIEADFILDDSTVNELSSKLNEELSYFKVLRIARMFNGEYTISFPNSVIRELEKDKLKIAIETCQRKIEIIPEWNKLEVENNSHSFLESLTNYEEKYSKDDLMELKGKLTEFKNNQTGKKQKIKEHIDELIEFLESKISLVDSGITNLPDDIKEMLIDRLPKFVYYSDYGNLDAEIYLPHVIENFDRDDIAERDRAKVRTLKVLFSFVSLEPKEILELGKETNNRRYERNGTLIQDQAFNRAIVKEEAENKKKREVLLQSASSRLTKEFKSWWGQGNYIFRFSADGNHFRIWVSDRLRPEEVELEGRSKGLQWFFSFFLVFLVESKDNLSNCIILLDEPGASLHPIAQRDLSLFLRNLSKSNQVLYTTHSPFLVDNSAIENIRAVFIDDTGNSVVSHDLRKNNKIAEQSIYPVHASLGLTISDTLLLGCRSVLVEGPSDHIYLHLIKKYLLKKGKYPLKDEVVFIPTGGVKGMSPIINILYGKDSKLPFVILDSDNPGKEKEANLKKNLYKGQETKIITINSLTEKDNHELEDILPLNELARVFSKKIRGNDNDFDEVFTNESPIIGQMERFACENGLKLVDGWKVELASDFSRGFNSIMDRIPPETDIIWCKLFDRINMQD